MNVPHEQAGMHLPILLPHTVKAYPLAASSSPKYPRARDCSATPLSSALEWLLYHTRSSKKHHCPETLC